MSQVAALIDDSLIYSRRRIFIINQIMSYESPTHTTFYIYRHVEHVPVNGKKHESNKNSRVHVGREVIKHFPALSCFLSVVIALRRWVLLFLEDIKCCPDDVQIISMEFLWGSVDKAVLTFWARVNEPV